MGHLSLNTVKEETNKYNEQVKVEFTDGNHLYIQRYFSNQKIKEVFDKFTKSFEVARTKDFEKEINSIPSIDLLSCFIIEGFTDLKFSNVLKVKLKEFKMLLNTDYYDQIIKAFDKKEIEKFFVRITETINTLEKLQNNMTEFNDQVQKINNKKGILFPEATKGSVKSEQESTN